MSISTGLRRGLRALVPLLAIAGLVFTTAAPANAAVIEWKDMQIFIPGSGTTERINVSRARDFNTITQVLVNDPIPTGKWVEVHGESKVNVGEKLLVRLYRSENGSDKEYKKFFTIPVPADDKKFFWIDTGQY